LQIPAPYLSIEGWRTAPWAPIGLDIMQRKMERWAVCGATAPARIITSGLDHFSEKSGLRRTELADSKKKVTEPDLITGQPIAGTLPDPASDPANWC